VEYFLWPLDLLAVWTKWNPNRRRPDKEKANILNIVPAPVMEHVNVIGDKDEND
tara:strand:+ start:1369 stop:1530 length:162 start_codon:yes stop_codon:yes gene_type:complete